MSASQCQHYGMVIKVDQCIGCKACVAACAVGNQTAFWDDLWRTQVYDIELGTYPNTHRVFIPRLCMQCENPPCVAVCPTGASHVIDGGIVVVDETKCSGCEICVQACPFGARYFYTNKDIQTSTQYFNPRRQEASVDKCDYCYEALGATSNGTYTPYCVATCPTEARVFGCLDDPTSEVAQLAASGQALALGSWLGVKPKTLYVFNNPEDTS